mmetsp:Transcript_4653/g.8471  ORF Transcript_4653/g.8471 Transcript_4653/m.8471 type:complete len:461 (-) Transcript_4653:217-1599(-)
MGKYTFSMLPRRLSSPLRWLNNRVEDNSTQSLAHPNEVIRPNAQVEINSTATSLAGSDALGTYKGGSPPHSPPRPEEGFVRKRDNKPEEPKFGMPLDTDIDLHSLLFLVTVREFNDRMKECERHGEIGRVSVVTAVVSLFSFFATFSQGFMLLSLYRWNDWRAARSAVFSGSDNVNLETERLVGSLLLYFFVMPEALSSLRLLISWWFISSTRSEPQSSSGAPHSLGPDADQNNGSRTPAHRSSGHMIIYYLQRVVVLLVFVYKIFMCIGTGAMAVSLCFYTPDEEGVQGIIMDFTGLLIIMEIDNIMLPFALEVVQMVAPGKRPKPKVLESIADEFLSTFTIPFKTENELRLCQGWVRWGTVVFTAITWSMTIVMLAFEYAHMGKCHEADIVASWTSFVETTWLCPESNPAENGGRCLNYDLYSWCSAGSAFCQQLREGVINEGSIFRGKTQCYDSMGP